MMILLAESFETIFASEQRHNKLAPTLMNLSDEEKEKDEKESSGISVRRKVDPLCCVLFYLWAGGDEFSLVSPL